MRKLLIVDDDAALRRLMRVELGAQYHVFDSGEPEQGLALALEHKPDAILLDLRMPTYSGYELLRTYATLSHTQGIPVVIVSGEAGAQTKEHCAQLGAAAYFEKPIDFDSLRACLKQIAAERPRNGRTNVQVPLRVSLKLVFEHPGGNKRTECVMTERAGRNGFEFCSDTDFPPDSSVEVYLVHPDDKYVGKAKIISMAVQQGGARKYEFGFLEKSGVWVLE
jgi:CheY-like chemotaxis protein